MPSRLKTALVSLALATCAQAVAGEVSIPAGHGLELSWDESTGRVTGISWRGDRIPCQGGFRLENPATGKGADLNGALSRRGETWSLSATALQVRLEAVIASQAGAAKVTGHLQGLTATDRAVRLVFALNFDALGWQWWDDIRRHRAIEAGHVYTEGYASSVYPFCCVQSDSHSISLAIPLDRYVTHRLLYDGERRELRLEFDFGLSPVTEKFPNRADFCFFIFSADPQWGFRAAAERYYRLTPDIFTTRARHGGLWMTFHDIATIPYAADFHFGFHENGANPAINRRLGVDTLHYVIPGQIDVLLPFDARRELSFDETEQMIRSDPAYAKLRDKLIERLEIMRDCVMHDERGKPRVRTMFANWARGRLIYDCFVDSDPDLPVKHSHAAYMDAVLKHADEVLENQGLDLEGVYLDNFGGGAPNYRREQWRSVDHPLTFRGRPPRPCTLTGIAEHEYAAHVGEMYPLVFANSWTRPHLFHTSVLDAGGTETHWATKQQRLGPRFDWDRVLMQGKVHCPLLKFDKDEFNALFSHLEDYLAECAFYGFYPSIYTSGGWRYQSFWNDPGMYEPHRMMFRHYLPAIDALHHAGWEPVTRALLSEEHLGIERFGDPEDGVFYLTVYNPLNSEAAPRLRSRLRLADSPVVAVDLLQPALWRECRGGAIEFTFPLQPGQCRLFMVTARETAVEQLWSRAGTAMQVKSQVDPDPLVSRLAPLRTALDRLSPASKPAALRSLTSQLRALLDDGIPRSPGVDRWSRLRALECYRWVSAAVALHNGIHLDQRAPDETPMPAGSRVSASGAEVRVLEPPSPVATDLLPEAAHRRVLVGVFFNRPDQAAGAPLMLARRLRTEWPVRLEPDSISATTIQVRATNRDAAAGDIKVRALEPDTISLKPNQQAVRLGAGEGRELEFRVSGRSSSAGQVQITWQAVGDDGRILGWRHQTIENLPPESNILPGADFEGWSSARPQVRLAGSARVVSEGPHHGTACLAVEAKSNGETHHCQWSIPLSGPPPRRVLVSGWSRAEDVSGNRDRDYSVWVGGRTRRDQPVHIGTAQFEPGTHDWQRAAAVFDVPQDVQVLNVWVIFRNHMGRAWFDDVYVAPAALDSAYNLARAARVTIDGRPAPQARVVVDGRRGRDAPAYAGEREKSPHALELTWSNPIQVSRVVVHWPPGEKRPLSSTEFAVQFDDGIGWRYWALGHTYVPEAISELQAPPVVTRRLRLVQALHGGSIDDRDRLHVSEIEVF